MFAVSVGVTLMKNGVWERFNSPLVVWFVGTVLFGLAASLIENNIANRKRLVELNERYDRLAFEYAGRLSQYSNWFVQNLLTDPHDLANPKLHACVTPTALRRSISRLAHLPSVAKTDSSRRSRGECKEPFEYGAAFDEFSKFSTIAVLGQMRIIHNEMLAKGNGRVLTHRRGKCEASKDENNMSHRITAAINAFLNTNAVIPLTWETSGPKRVE